MQSGKLSGQTGVLVGAPQVHDGVPGGAVHHAGLGQAQAALELGDGLHHLLVVHAGLGHKVPLAVPLGDVVHIGLQLAHRFAGAAQQQHKAGIFALRGGSLDGGAARRQAEVDDHHRVPHRLIHHAGHRQAEGALEALHAGLGLGIVEASEIGALHRLVEKSDELQQKLQINHPAALAAQAEHLTRPAVQLEGQRRAVGGAQALVLGVDAVPGGGANHAVHRQTEQLLIRPDRLRGGGAEDAVEGDGRDGVVVGGQQVQIILHLAHRLAGVALPQRAAGIGAGPLVGGHQIVGDVGVDLIQLVPGQLAHHAVHRKAEELLEGAHGVFGAAAEDAVHRDGRDGGIVGGGHPQIKLHQTHALPAVSAAQGRSGIASRTTGIEIFFDRIILIVERVPGIAPHDAVHRQAVSLLEGAHSRRGGGTKDAIHIHAGDAAVELGQFAEPELDLLHRSAGAAFPQRGAGVHAVHRLAGVGLALAGQLGHVLHCHIAVADLGPGVAPHHAVHRQAELLLEFLHNVGGVLAVHAVHRHGVEGGVVARDAVQLALDGAHRGAGAADAQRRAGIAFGDRLDAVGAHDLDVVAIVVLQDLQCVHAVLCQRDGAPLLHAVAGDALAVAVLGVVGVDGAGAAHIGVEDVVGDAAHHVKDLAAVHIILVVAGGVGDVEVISLARVPLGIHAVQRQADLRVDVGAQCLFRPGETDEARKVSAPS